MNVQRVFVIVVIFAAASSGSPCTTPDGKKGTCLPIYICPPVFNAASTKNSTALDFAKKSLCDDTEQLVCCEAPGSVVVPNFASKALPDRTACGVVKDEARIIGGEVADLGEFPWMVGIEFKSRQTGESKGMRCTGSLINNQYVLTAAHCLLNKDVEPTRVWLGEWKISTDPDCKDLVANVECAEPVKKVAVKETIPHVFYSDKTKSNDIGLIRLEKDVQFTDYVSPICLQYPNVLSPEPGTRMTVAGWGSTENGTASDVLRKVKVPLLQYEECFTKYSGKAIVTSQQLCAGGEKGKDSCSGDAGGPLMRTFEDKTSKKVQWYQEGVVSFGVRCGSADYPAVYTRVTSYMGWIINIISEE